MSATPKKPPATGAPTTTSGRRTPGASNTTSTPGAPSNRSPSRMNSQTAVGTASTPASIRRGPSVRGGPASARAAAAARKPGDAADEDAKAELQAKLDELQEKWQASERAHEDAQKQAAVLQVKLDEALKEQGILEDSAHESTERIEELENERKESVRARRELEQIYENERVAAMKEKEEAQTREDELQRSMQRMKETLAQRELRDRGGLDDEKRPGLSRTGSSRAGSHGRSPDPENSSGQFAPPASLQRSDSRSSSRLVHQKDKIIEQLRLELAEAQIKLVEMENKGGGSLQALEKDMYDIKIQNARLMEENESFQLLLSDKTLNGEFGQSDLLRPASIDARPPSRSPTVQDGGTNLADELEGHDDVGSEAGGENERRLQADVKRLEDQNKALTLYINNIVSRLLMHDGFEQILNKSSDPLSAGPVSSADASTSTLKPTLTRADTDKDLPPPPPPTAKDHALPALPTEEAQTGAGGFLQRAKSVMGRTRQGRPQSTTVQPHEIPKLDEPSVTENPQTAPSIPLGRSASHRRGHSHARQNSEWPAANVVTRMVGTPSGVPSGPTSPGLASPGSTRGGFFGAMAGRSVSGGNAPTSATSTPDPFTSHPSQSQKENHRPSDSLDPADAHAQAADALDGTISSNPSSPPRSTTSSGEGGRDVRSGGAVMMGSKPRPLRLAQQAEDEAKAKKAANRGSWFGWMNKGEQPPGAAGGAAIGGAGAGQMASAGAGVGGRFSMYGRSVSGSEQQGQGQGQGGQQQGGQ